MSDGELCPSGDLITTADDCKAAGEFLQLKWAGTWNGDGDYQNCIFANDDRSAVLFNLSPNPSQTANKPNYAPICKTGGPKTGKEM